jgi:predicted HTH domain antitoxin
VHASKQNWAAANAAYAQALAAGGLRREQEFRLHYAISLIKAGQKEQAMAQLKAVQGDATAVEIATLWQLLAR